MTCHYPELVPTKVYQDDYDIITDAVCDYMEGPGTEKLVTELYEAVQGHIYEVCSICLRNCYSIIAHCTHREEKQWAFGSP